MASTFTPLGNPPLGVTPNFDNPTDTLFPEIVATVVLSVLLTTGFTAARLVAKRAMTDFTIEDYFSIATWAMFMGYIATFMLQGVAGIGRHIWDIRIEQAPRISQLSWAIELMYCILTFLAKAALLLQMQRTFSPTRSGAVYIACQVLIYANLAFYLSSFIALVFECVPQERIWNPHIKTGRCIEIGALLIAMGVINVISDFMIIILPIWAISHLRMSMKMKLGVGTIFATGILAIACSICRLVYTFPPLHSEDVSYLFAPVGMWSIAELASIMLCTSFPLMPRFLQVVTGKNGMSTHSSRQKYQYERYGHGGSGTHNTIRSTATGGKKCLNCQQNMLCALHESGIQSAEEDEQRLYIHKTVSVELTTGSRQEDEMELAVIERA